MRLKKYRVATMADALESIRRDLGPDAVVLHSRDLSSPGLFGLFRRPLVEVVAATDDDQSDGPPKAPVRRSPSSSAGSVATSAPSSNGSGHPRAETAEPRSDSEPSTGPSPALPRPSPDDSEGNPRPDRALLESISRQLDDLRQAVTRLNGPTGSAGPGAESEAIAHCQQVLLGQDVAPDLTADVMRAVRRDLSADAQRDAITVRDAAASRLARRLATTGPLHPYADVTRVVFLVGPTGVGKTTTLAKLAATLAMQRHSVMLVTADTFRIAAIPQLQTYADILRIPLEVVYTPPELAALLAAHTEPGVILVDTPGRSQYRDEQIDELASFVATAPSRTVYLAVSAATRRDELAEIAARFGRIPLDGLLFTKLDETAHLGAIATLAADLGKPLSYFTTGQNVPSDIEVADPARLAGRILAALDA